MNYSRLAERLYNTPLLLLPEKAEIIERVFDAALHGQPDALAKGESAEQREVREAKEYAALMVPARRVEGGYSLTSSGVAIASMHGSMVQRAGMFDSLSGMTSYQNVMQKLDAAFRDPLVRGIVLDADSPGGEVAGAFELADFIADAPKPVWAVANELAASAAYLVASAAERVIVPQAAQVGSIGVLMLHADRSAVVERSGVRYTPIFAGAKKLDGSSLAPLSEGARLDLQRRVDEVYGMFVDAVASRRGIKPAAVRATEAGMLSAESAVSEGFADQVGTLTSAIQDMQAKVNAFGYHFTPRAARASTEESDMTDPKDKAAPAPTTATTEQLANERAAAYAAAEKELVPKAKAESVLAERARVDAILSCEEAKGREAMARHLALKTAHSVEDAKALLAVAPKEAAATPNPLNAAMPPNPAIGAGPGEPAKAPAPEASAIYGRMRDSRLALVKQ